MQAWKKIFHANRDQKKAGVAILISDKIDLKTKAEKRDKERQYIMIKVSIQEDITIINIYAAAAAKLLQSCPTLCDPRDGSPPGSAIPGILQERTLEWVAISFSNA